MENTSKRMKRQMERTYFQITCLIKNLYSEYKELLKLSNMQTNNPIRNAKNLNQRYTSANKYLKRCSIPPQIRRHNACYYIK
jgi:hypothetical protein